MRIGLQNEPFLVDEYGHCKIFKSKADIPPDVFDFTIIGDDEDRASPKSR